MVAPCKDCEERHEGCHAGCEKYIAFKERLAKVAEEREKANSAMPVLCKRVIRQIWREMKRR